jgi:hypothetical protein
MQALCLGNQMWSRQQRVTCGVPMDGKRLNMGTLDTHGNTEHFSSAGVISGALKDATQVPTRDCASQ